MRIGNNPLREKEAPYSFKDIIFLVVTHLPDNNDYHAERFEVVKTCLSTMRQNSKRDHTFMVWDNGSSHSFKVWLEEDFSPDVLILSKNIGKNQARANAIRMMPLSSIVCYSDDDIYYYDNWLNPQIKILNHFNAQLVTGYPLRVMFRWGIERTKAWCNKHGKLESGLFLPEQWEKDYAVSIGRDPEVHLNESLTKNDKDWRVSFNGTQAYCTGHHCQFIGYIARIQQALESSYNMAMDDEKPFDIANDKLGLRLATIDRLTRHIGNVLDDKLQEEINNVQLQDTSLQI